MRLIDADELVRTTDELSEGAGFYKPIYEWFSKAVKNQPTIDAVPVVRCEECERRDKDFVSGNGTICCPYMEAFMEPDDFCSYGERKSSLLNKGGTEE